MTGFIQRMLTRGSGKSLVSAQVPLHPRPQSRFEPGRFMAGSDAFSGRDSRGTQESGLENSRENSFESSPIGEESAGRQRMPSSRKQTDVGDVSGTKEKSTGPLKSKAPQSSEPSSSGEPARVRRTAERTPAGDSSHPDKSFSETVPTTGQEAETLRDRTGSGSSDSPLEKAVVEHRPAVSESAQNKAAFQVGAETPEKSQPLVLNEFNAHPQETNEATDSAEPSAGGKAREREKSTLPAAKSSDYFSAEEAARSRSAEFDEARPEMTVSIGQIQVEFVQPEPHPAPQPKPAVQRTRGFDNYARARRGVRRR